MRNAKRPCEGLRQRGGEVTMKLKDLIDEFGFVRWAMGHDEGCDGGCDPSYRKEANRILLEINAELEKLQFKKTIAVHEDIAMAEQIIKKLLSELGEGECLVIPMGMSASGDWVGYDPRH